MQPDVELRRMAKPPPAVWGVRQAAAGAHPAAKGLRGSPERLRDAIILREVLGPPIAYRRLRRG